MPRESFKAKAARCAEILRKLDAAYPNAHCELNYTNPLELLIKCTDQAAVHKVYRRPVAK